MNYFMMIPPNHPEMIKTIKALGKHGAFDVLTVVAEARQQKISNFDSETIANWAKVKLDRAEKILPFASKILVTTEEILVRSKKISVTSEEILVSDEDFTPSNPRGSIKEEEIDKTEEKEREKGEKPPNKKNGSGELTFPKSPAGEIVAYLHAKLRQRGITDTFLNRDWLRINVNEANQLLNAAPKDKILEAIDWFSTDSWWADKFNRLSHVRKHWDQFERKKTSFSSKFKGLSGNEIASFDNLQEGTYQL